VFVLVNGSRIGSETRLPSEPLGGLPVAGAVRRSPWGIAAGRRRLTGVRAVRNRQVLRSGGSGPPGLQSGQKRRVRRHR